MKLAALSATLVWLAVGTARGDIAAGQAPVGALRPSLDGAPWKGSPAAKVTIVVFSDFQCPFCARVEPVLTALLAQYGDALRVVWKNNPLEFHRRARPAALAAMAAHAQGKFWPMHDRLFAAQQSLDDASFARYAAELGLDEDRWRATLASPALAAHVAADQAEAAKLGAVGTPSFFINARRFVGAQPQEKFAAVIDAELARADQLLASGVPRAQLYATLMKDGVDPAPAARGNPAAAADDPYVHRAVVGRSPARGPADAKVTIVEWGDFQCPFSGRVEVTLERLRREYGNDLRVVWKHLPLPFHDHAQLAAEAAAAARAQLGDHGFWEMHRLLFANQTALERADLQSYAAVLGLDLARFDAALDAHTYRAEVQADSAAGTALGATGTPSFFINGRRLVGAYPYEVFKQKIDLELKRADAAIAAGTPAARLYDTLMKNAASEPTPAPPGAAAEREADADKVYEIDPGVGPARGPRNAPVQLVMFTDFECPFCARALPTVAQVEARYPGKVRIVFRNMPLPFHSHAQLAAEAALAAHEQGKFWPMHDLLFARQRALERADLERYAGELGLDVARFRASLDSGKFRAAVDADRAAAEKVGARGTPTFFINGRRLVGAQPFEAFERLVDAALAPRRK